MRDYSKVSPRFWTGETGKEIRKLGAPTQVIAFYLFTCPSANMLGLYYLAMPTLCHETASPFEGALEALRSLENIGFAHYHTESEYVFVPNMAREQIGVSLKRKDNRHIAVLKELETLRKTPFFNAFVEMYRDAYELHDVKLGKPLASPSGGPSEPLRSPFTAPPKPLRSQEQDQEQEQEQKQEQEQEGERSNGNARAKRSPPTRIPDDFVLTDDRRAYAIAKGIEPEPTFEAFSAYWRSKAKDNTKLDWDATWHTWVLKDAKDLKARTTPRKTRFDEIMEMRRANEE